MSTFVFITGSDQELSIVKAVAHSFHQAVHVFCTLHLKKNVTAHLDIQLIDKKIQRQIRKKLWKRNGLVWSEPVEEFEIKRREFETEFGQYFSKRYLHYLMLRIRNNVMEPHLVSDAINCDWTNNNAESMNAKLKRDAKDKILSLPELIDLFTKVFDNQRDYVKMAFQEYGKYNLAKWMQKKQFMFRPEVWKRMTDEEKFKILSEFFKGLKRKPECVTSKDGTVKVPNRPRRAGKPGGARRRKANDKTRSGPKKTSFGENVANPKKKKAGPVSKKSAKKSAIADKHSEDEPFDSLNIFKNKTLKKDVTANLKSPVQPSTSPRKKVHLMSPLSSETSTSSSKSNVADDEVENARPNSDNASSQSPRKKVHQMSSLSSKTSTSSSKSKVDDDKVENASPYSDTASSQSPQKKVRHSSPPTSEISTPSSLVKEEKRNVAASSQNPRKKVHNMSPTPSLSSTRK